MSSERRRAAPTSASCRTRRTRAFAPPRRAPGRRTHTRRRRPHSPRTGARFPPCSCGLPLAGMQQRPRGDEPPIKTRSPHRPDLLAWATSESPGAECSRVRLTIQQRELASGVRGGDVFKPPPLSFLRLISDQELGVLELQAVLERQGAAEVDASLDGAERFLRA